MSQLDPRKSGQITETMFIKNIKKYYSAQELNECFNFDLIPPNVLEETQRQQSIAGSSPSIKDTV